MTKFIVDLYLDGYEDEVTHDLACKEFIVEQLDMCASSVQVTDFEESSDNFYISALVYFNEEQGIPERVEPVFCSISLEKAIAASKNNFDDEAGWFNGFIVEEFSGGKALSHPRKKVMYLYKENTWAAADTPIALKKKNLIFETHV